jgi:hypothetical protein
MHFEYSGYVLMYKKPDRHVCCVVQNNFDRSTVSDTVTNVTIQSVAFHSFQYFGDSKVRNLRHGSRKSYIMLLFSVSVTAIWSNILLKIEYTA